MVFTHCKICKTVLTHHNMKTKRTILITGASSGIGKESAQALIAMGHIVYVAARRVEKMDDLRELGCIPLKMDVTQESDIVDALETIKAQHGGVDVLFNNAGFGLYGPMENISIDEARYQFEVNLFGLARVTQLVIPQMREKGWGRIINTSSMGGKVYTPLGAWYHATKHALEGWSDSLRLELEPFGIDVVILEPGAIKTEFGEVMSRDLMERTQNSPYAKMGKGLMEMQKKEYESGGGSDPRVISDLVVKAIEASRPQTRYVAGKYARPMLFLRRWVSDRAFDRIIRSMIK